MAYLYYLINETVKLNKENIFGLRTVNSELQCVCVCVCVCVCNTNQFQKLFTYTNLCTFSLKSIV